MNFLRIYESNDFEDDIPSSMDNIDESPKQGEMISSPDGNSKYFKPYQHQEWNDEDVDKLFDAVINKHWPGLKEMYAKGDFKDTPEHVVWATMAGLDRFRKESVIDAADKKDVNAKLYSYWHTDNVGDNFVARKTGGKSKSKITYEDDVTRTVNGRTYEYGKCKVVTSKTQRKYYKLGADGKYEEKAIITEEYDPDKDTGMANSYESSKLNGMISTSEERSKRLPTYLSDITLGDVKTIAMRAKVDIPVWDVIATILEDYEEEWEKSPIKSYENGEYQPQLKYLIDTPKFLKLNYDIKEKSRFDNFAPGVIPKCYRILRTMEEYLEGLPR
jgi:hypothetical protein